jgi:hypothetical protein
LCAEHVLHLFEDHQPSDSRPPATPSMSVEPGSAVSCVWVTLRLEPRDAFTAVVHGLGVRARQVWAPSTVKAAKQEVPREPGQGDARQE